MLAYRKSTLHAIAAVDALARAYHTRCPRLTSLQIARRGKLAQPSIAKDLLCLQRHGVIKSMRGRGGGYELARPPEQIYLTEILRACGESADHVSCLLGQETCDCPLRQRLRTLRQSIAAVIAQVTLRDHCEHARP